MKFGDFIAQFMNTHASSNGTFEDITRNLRNSVTKYNAIYAYYIPDPNIKYLTCRRYTHYMILCTRIVWRQLSTEINIRIIVHNLKPPWPLAMHSNPSTPPHPTWEGPTRYAWLPGQVHVMGERSYHSHITDSTEHSTVTGLVGWTDMVEGVVYNSHTWCSHTEGQAVWTDGWPCSIYTACYIESAHFYIRIHSYCRRGT